MRILLTAALAMSFGLLASVAQAESFGANANSGLYATAGLGVLNPNNEEISTESAPTVAVGYAFNENWSAEAGVPVRAYRERVSVDGVGQVGAYRIRPYTASVLYHFGDLGFVNGALKPYVGAGYAWSHTSDERGRGPLTGIPVSLDNSNGALGRVGLDYSINQNWFGRVDATYLDLDTHGRVAGLRSGEIANNSWQYGLQVGYRF